MSVENVSLNCEQNPLALIKGSPIPITQHSELLNAAYTLTILLSPPCCYFFFSFPAPTLVPALWLRGSWQGDRPSLSPLHQTGLPLQDQALCSLMPSTVPVLAVLIADWPRRSWTCSLPPPGQPLAPMHRCESGWMWILVWIPSDLSNCSWEQTHTSTYLLLSPWLRPNFWKQGLRSPNRALTLSLRVWMLCKFELDFLWKFLFPLLPDLCLSWRLICPYAEKAAKTQRQGCWINDARNSGRIYMPTTVDTAWTDCHT